MTRILCQMVDCIYNDWIGNRPTGLCMKRAVVIGKDSKCLEFKLKAEE